MEGEQAERERHRDSGSGREIERPIERPIESESQTAEESTV